MINPMSRTDGGPAFATDPDPKAWEGMSLLDWMAGQALLGMCANPNFAVPTSPADLSSAAKLAYGFARAMLAERRKGNGPSDKV